MQFGGQRTDSNLEPIGEPDNVYIKITPDVLPDPGAALVTGITPQKTLSDGLSEADFTAYFQDKIFKPSTIFVGYNNIRFDDEFVRHLLYRNFYDAYEWQWQDGCSRWDLLDVARMTRALRPEGIKWPFNSEGKPSNQLGLLSSINTLDHQNAHDALSDVQATIALARLIRTKQPKLFNYLLEMRDKKQIAELVKTSQPFIYTSGKYSSDFEKTTAVIAVVDHPTRAGAIVYDLRYDPTPFSRLSASQLAAAWYRRDPEEGIILPVKSLQYNRCPAVAPLSVMDKSSQTRLKIDLKIIKDNAIKLAKLKDFPARLLEAQKMLDKKQKQLFADERDIDNQLYDNFISGPDKQVMRLVRTSRPDGLSDLKDKFKDTRLKAMLPLYKARNYPTYLTQPERQDWEEYCFNKLASGEAKSRLSSYFEYIDQLQKQPRLGKEQKYLFEELQLYGESILPTPV